MTQKNYFENLMSLSDAAKQWHIDESTLRRAISSGRFTENYDVKKFGKQWIITNDAMSREYGAISKHKVLSDKKYSPLHKREIYNFMSQCLLGYSRQAKVSIEAAAKNFDEYQIWDYIYECYDYLHLSGIDENIKDISSRIRRAIHFA